jgi:hypothetical protein
MSGISMRKGRCSDLITSVALLDNRTLFLIEFIENIRGMLLALSKDMLELSENSLRTSLCAHIP